MTAPTTPPPDWTALGKALLHVGRAAAAAFDQIAAAARAFAELVERACSAWLHVSCTSEHVRCTCTCHHPTAETSATRAAAGRWPVLS